VENIWRGLIACWVIGLTSGCAGSAPSATKRAPSTLSTAPPPAKPPGAAALKLSAEPLSLQLSEEPLVYDHASLDREATMASPVAARGQTYALPLRRAALINLERDVVGKGILDSGSPELRALLERGMVIVQPPTWAAGQANSWRFDLTYERLRDSNVPVIVTADAVLHQQHVFFNEILKAVELRTLAPMLTSLVSGLYQELLPALSRSSVSEAVVNELSVLALARKQLEPGFEPHSALAARVSRDLELMRRHAGVGISSSQSDEECIASDGASGRCYFEDFSQYVVRGHYTASPVLERYFLASMWLGRVGRRFKFDSEIAQQVLLIEAAKRATCSFRGEQVKAVWLLSRIDQLLQYFVGKSDDLTLPEVDGVLRSELGDERVALTPAVLADLRVELRKLRGPRILSGVTTEYGHDAAATTRDETQGLRLLGQRFAADSEILGRLVFEHVGPDPEHPRFAEVANDAANNRRDYCDGLPMSLRQSLAQLDRAELSQQASRCLCERSLTLWRGQRQLTREALNQELSQVCRLMPSALDVASVMGSALADRYLLPSRRYAGYERELLALRASHAAALTAAPENLYGEWLAALSPLLSPVAKGYPTWMAGVGYDKKALRTFAASWTELRHDTILYVKQSYTGGRIFISSSAGPAQPKEPEAYGIVEARPELYQRVRSFTSQLRKVLGKLEALPAEVDASLAHMDGVLARLIEISNRQLEGKPLDVADQRYIKDIGTELLRVSSQLVAATTPPAEPLEPREGMRVKSSAEGLDTALRVPMVADVHTDLHTQRVLQQGTGPLEWMLAVTRMPDGALSVAAGPVFSYKEFVHPLNDRLTNEKWRGPMGAGRDLPAPLWWTSDRSLANGFQSPPFATPPP
jgi:hypothetical protein